ncbi:interleukin-8-like [Salmo trutta]|uniref:Chemokine (C-X-C motif) ligand 8a n=1 Tax=Salmo trutta TaxID=8032 RepID=A0A674AV71_SALTR|nr:interleukin-8-like [Salmo trutta]
MKMSIRMSDSSIGVLLALLTITEGMSLSDVGSDLRCRCIQMERRRIGKVINKVEMFPPSSHCKDTEIIATLKGSGKEICLDVSAPWVKKIIEQILAKHKRNSYSPKTWNKRASKKP